MTDERPDEQEVQDLEAVEVMDGAVALSAVDRAAIDVQVATAKQYPRSITQAKADALSLATLDEETAAGCMYELKRGGKFIDGPTIRLAEIMAHSWGNLRVDADIIAEDKNTVTAMGTCFDLEKNVAVRIRTTRRITNKHGQRYNEDMIAITKNAAISIVLRNAIFKVIPAVFTKEIYQAARLASVGDAGTITEKRKKFLDWFAEKGVKPEQIFGWLEVGGIDDIGRDELIRLRGLTTAINDGETSIKQAFDPQRHSDQTGDLNAALKVEDTEATFSQVEALRTAWSGQCKAQDVTKKADQERLLMQLLGVESFDQITSEAAAGLCMEISEDPETSAGWIQFQVESESK